MVSSHWNNLLPNERRIAFCVPKLASIAIFFSLLWLCTIYISGAHTHSTVYVNGIHVRVFVRVCICVSRLSLIYPHICVECKGISSLKCLKSATNVTPTQSIKYSEVACCSPLSETYRCGSGKEEKLRAKNTFSIWCVPLSCTLTPYTIPLSRIEFGTQDNFATKRMGGLWVVRYVGWTPKRCITRLKSRCCGSAHMCVEQYYVPNPDLVCLTRMSNICIL